MKKRAHEVLRALADLPEGDDDATVLCEGRRCYAGLEPISRETLNEMLRAGALGSIGADGPIELYVINDVGRAIVRRPELADEVAAAFQRGRPFSIHADRVRPLTNPTPSASDTNSPPAQPIVDRI